MVPQNALRAASYYTVVILILQNSPYIDVGTILFIFHVNPAQWVEWQRHILLSAGMQAQAGQLF